MKEKIINYIRAGYPGLYVVSAEEQRVEAEMQTVADELKYELHYWTVIDGLVNVKKQSTTSANDPLEALQVIEDMNERSIVLVKDFHLHLVDPNPFIIRKLKDVLQTAKTKNITFIVVACRLCLPPELEREMTVVEFALPDREQLGIVLTGIVDAAKLKQITGDDRDKVLDAASGLTTIEAENAFALSVVLSKKIDPVLVAREKAQVVKKNGLLELIDTHESLESIGGLDILKDWLLKRRQAFTKKAVDYGLPTPKGLLMVGCPGTGKSLTAKATAKVFGVPLLKLDAGRIFAGLVGQSESNLRSVIQTAEAIAPCCLWVDEIEKAFSGSKSSGSTDGGTSARVFGSFISWMQEKSSAVFIVATANDVSQLPPEMLRKGRLDELFFVDLPNEEERKAIWEIVIAKFGRDAKDFDLVQLARITDGFTGSEIQSAFFDAMFAAFEEDGEPTDLHIAQVLNGFVPLSKTMAEQIDGVRKWSKGRCRLATSQQQPERKLRKLAA